jgi:hypothetical protein
MIIPVIDRYAKGFPEHGPAAGKATYGDFADACETEFEWDAHFCAYSAPDTPYRLATVKALDAHPAMVAFVIDIDGPDHKCPDEWFEAELAKVDKLPVQPYGYRTRGGYRLVWALTEAFPLRTMADINTWSASYTSWLECLATQYHIHGDTNCKDWTRCYRLPRVTRDGVISTPEEFGTHPSDIGVWPLLLVEAPAPVTTTTFTLTTAKHKASEAELIEAVKLLASVWPKTGRHGASLALAGALAHGGWDVEDITDFVTAVSGLAAGDDGEPIKRRDQANDSVNKLERGEPVAGWGVLIEKVGNSKELETARKLIFGDPTELFSKARAEAKERNKPKPPSESALAAHYRATRTKLSRSSNQIKSADYLALKGVFRENGPVEIFHTEQLKETAIALVRNAPPGATDDQLAGLLAHVVATPEIALGAITDARTSLAPDDDDGDDHIELDSEFACDENGKPYPSQNNLDIAFQKMGVVITYDEFACQKLITEPGTPTTVLQDHHVVRLRFAIDKHFRFMVNKDFFADFIDDRAINFGGFHPVKALLDSLEWDGTDRIDNWLHAYGGAEDTPYTRAVGRLVLIAAVRRIRQPGCKFDEMLILEGVQGTNKSTALQTLAMNKEWFTDNLPLDSDAKEQMESLAGKWIVEAGELNGMRKSDENHLKTFLSRSIDQARMAYGREVTRRPRQSIIIGSTNDGKYLKDKTGNRRYWPVEIVRFDLEALERDVFQLWGEACYYESQGESIRLAPALWPLAAQEQEKRRQEDPFEGIIEEILGEYYGRVRSRDVGRILGYEDVPPLDAYRRISDAMKRCGWEKSNGSIRFRKGEKCQAYMRGTDAQREDIIDIAPGGRGGYTVAITPREKLLNEITGAKPS